MFGKLVSGCSVVLAVGGSIICQHALCVVSAITRSPVLFLGHGSALLTARESTRYEV